MFLQSFNLFRAVAIIMIVAGHAIFLTHWPPQAISTKFLFNIIEGGTALFVFISGYLFHFIFYKRFDYRKFMVNKGKNVVSPYVVWTLLSVAYFVYYLGWRPLEQELFIGEGFFWEYVYPIAGYLVTGAASQPYWYIPFIMIIFALSPVFLWYIRASLSMQLALLGISIVVAMAIHRPMHNILIPQAVLYYLHMYFAGILVSLYREPIFRVLKGRDLWLLAVVVILALVQAKWFEIAGNFHKAPLTLTVPDILVVQKLVMALFFTVFLARLENRPMVMMNELAGASFAIYFMHPFILGPSFICIDWLSHGLLPPTVSLALITIQTLLACYGIAWVIKRLSGERSRLLLGW